MHHRSTILAFSIATSLVALHGAQAQSTDSMTFRPGQWGAEFSAGTQFSSVGVLRFRTARQAWVADLAANSTQLSGATLSDARNTVFSLRLGSRWFHTVVPRVQQFATVGVLGGASSNKVESIVGITSTTSGWNVGAFANVGALWFAASRLSLAAAWEASGSYGRLKTSTTNNSEITARQTVFSLGAATLRLGLYF